MGQACRYCTLWADGLNGIIDHLEEAIAVVLVSPDPAPVQRKMALNRGWRFRLASHGGGPYMREECAVGEHLNMPGAATYQRVDGQICRRSRTIFGPGDLYSPFWHALALAGLGLDDFTPQYRYWRSPEDLDDGGANRNDA